MTRHERGNAGNPDDRGQLDGFADVPFEEIGGLVISPQTDIPFGKLFRMGFAQYTIYDRAVEQGYQVGIQTHLAFLHDHHTDTPALLDDASLTQLLNVCTPRGLSEHDAAMWRGAFILGWASVSLGLVRDHPAS